MTKSIIMHQMGTIMPLRVKTLKTDLPLIAVTPSRVMIQYFVDHGFKEIRSTDEEIPELAIITNLRFRASSKTRQSRVVALSETMLHSLTSKFSKEFRHSSSHRLVICSMLSPEKTWPIFRNLGIHGSAFGSREAWEQKFTVGYDHPAGYRIINGMKNIDELIRVVEPYIQKLPS